MYCLYGRRFPRRQCASDKGAAFISLLAFETPAAPTFNTLVSTPLPALRRRKDGTAPDDCATRRATTKESALLPLMPPLNYFADACSPRYFYICLMASIA